jgi:hypothetical protein
VARIIELADAGGFTVPKRWRELHEAAELVDLWASGAEHDATPREATAALERAAIDAVRSAAVAARKLPDAPVAKFAAAYRALADPMEREARTAVFEGALASADGGLLVVLRRAVSDGFEVFVVKSLRPAHTAVLGELEAAGALVGRVEDRGSEELDEISDGRAVWDRIAHELLPRFHAIHEAHQLGWAIAAEPKIADAGDRHDRGTHLELRNRYRLAPDARTGLPPADMPEASGPLALWLTSMAEPWLPLLSDFEQLDVDRRAWVNDQAREATRRATGTPREAEPTAGSTPCDGCGRPIEWNGFGFISETTGIDCDGSADGLHHADALTPAPAA